MAGNTIVVLSVPRSGTTFLCSELALYRNLRVLYEFFKPVTALNVPNFKHILNHKELYSLPENQEIIEKHIGYMPHKTHMSQQEYEYILGESESKGLTFLLDKIADDPLGALDRAHEVIHEDLCIKIHRHHTIPLYEILSRPNVYPIILQRRDHLARHVSHLKAMKTGKWFNADTSNVKVSVNFPRFRKERDDINKWYSDVGAYLKEIEKPHKKLFYEDFLTNYDRNHFFEMMDPIISKLGISIDKRPRTTFAYHKQMTKNILYSIANVGDAVHTDFYESNVSCSPSTT